MNGGYIILNRYLTEDILKNINTPGDYVFNGVFDILENAIKTGKNIMMVSDNASYFCDTVKAEVKLDTAVTLISIVFGTTQIASSGSDKNKYTVNNLIGG